MARPKTIKDQVSTLIRIERVHIEALAHRAARLKQSSRGACIRAVLDQVVKKEISLGFIPSYQLPSTAPKKPRVKRKRKERVSPSPGSSSSSSSESHSATGSEIVAELERLGKIKS